MTLTRKVRRNGASFVITIPADISKLLELTADDIVSYELDTNLKTITIQKI